MERLHLLNAWIKTQFPNNLFTLQSASSDASFRCYFRIVVNDSTFIVMDAPPQHEDCTPFLQVGKLLKAADVHVPEVLAQDLEQGFLLLSDLGDTTYLQALTADIDAANDLYGDAVDALVQIQSKCLVDGLPQYDEALLQKELNLFPDWYIAKHLKITLTSSQRKKIDAIFKQVQQKTLSQSSVFVHRDYHSRNLMVTLPNPGIIDFQDAVNGPITYDLVSLFKDAYIRWDEAQIIDWVVRYWEKARLAGLPVAVDFGEFYRDFEWMGVQRHIKVLGIFARLSYRDGKMAYLDDMPWVMAYLRKTCDRYRELQPLLDLLDEFEDLGSNKKIGYTF